jgi:RNA polymerase sigma-70 factor (ECF subfamily)
MRFEAQVMPHLDAAYRLARWLARSSVDAEDIVQDAVLRAYRGFDALRGSEVRAWLLTIVRNCHATSYRQQKSRPTVPLPEEGDTEVAHAMVSTEPDPESASILKDDERNFEQLMSRLSEEHREVLALRELEEMSYREIAVVTSLPIGTVMSRLARARSALKQVWLTQTEGEPSGVR